MLALLGATSVMMLDHGLRSNIDDSLDSVARAIAESVRRPSFFPPGIEDTLESMLRTRNWRSGFSSCLIGMASPTHGWCRPEDRNYP
jgi:hypothetical protein